MARIPLIAGNWKLNLDHLEATHATQKLAWLLQDAKHNFGDVEVVVLPSFTSIRSVQTLIDADKLPVKVGAQDISAETSGAFTGEVSGVQLAKLNVSYVAVGHSERREYHGESDAVVGAKVKAAFDHGIIPILCVGEGLDVRKAGKQVEYTLAQLDGALDGLPAENAAARSWSPTSPCGPSAPARSRPLQTRKRCAAQFALVSASSTAPRSPTPCVCSTAVP